MEEKGEEKRTEKTGAKKHSKVDQIFKSIMAPSSGVELYTVDLLHFQITSTDVSQS